MPLYSYNNKHKDRSRSLRKNQTDAEQLLWSKLRARHFYGYKFRRQHPISYYILDFYCEEEKFAIELDGSQHSKPSQRDYDKRRTRVLQELGIRVLRFWDSDVLRNTDGVLEEIAKHIQTSS